MVFPTQLVRAHQVAGQEGCNPSARVSSVQPLSFLSLDCPGHSPHPIPDKRIGILVTSLKPFPLPRVLLMM